MEALLARYGYLILFPGIVVEGEAFLLAGAFMAHRGVFDLPIVIAVAVAATMCGDQLYYRAARARGRSWLERRKGSRAKYEKWIAMTEKRGVWLLLASRWTFGLRIVIPAACGAVGMSPTLFTAVDFVAVLIWACTLGFAGYYSGAAIERHLKDIQHVGIWVLVAVVLCVASVVGARRVQRQARVRELNVNDLHAIVPFVIGMIGVFNLFMALWPRRAAAMANLARWVPLDVPESNRLVMLFAGLALLQVTRNLARRKEMAWWVALVALASSVVSQVAGPAFEIQHTIVALALLAYLIAFRRRFSAQSDPSTVRRALLTAPVLGALIVGYGFIGLRTLEPHFQWPAGTTILQETVRAGLLVAQPHIRPLDLQASRFLGSLQVAGWVARLYVLVLLLRPVILRVRMEAPPEDVERIRTAYATRPLTAFALRPDKHHLLVAGGRGLVAYTVRNAVAVACGGPLCAPEDVAESTRDFLEHCRRHGWSPCLYAVPGEDLPAYAAARLKSLRVGEEGMLDPVAIASANPPAADSGLTVWRYDRGADASTVLDEQIAEVSDEWLADHEIGELHFTFGSLDLDELAKVPVFVCGSPERLEAFCTWLPYASGTGMALDLLRRRRDAREGCREALLARSLEALAASGVREVSLGLVPAIAAANGEKANAGPFGLADRLGAIYRYDDLFALKDRLAPKWEPRHLVYPGDADLPHIAVAIVDAHTTLHERSPLPRLVAAARALRREGVAPGRAVTSGSGRGFLAGFGRWIDALPGGLVFALALGTVAVIGIADEVTGAEVTLTVLYLLPVWFASWFLGARPGLVVALAAAIAWWAADVATRYYAPRPSVVAADAGLQLALFGAVAGLSAHVRRRGERESALVRTDALTGLLNRRGFLEVARREIARSGRSGRPLTVALLDVDGFREINEAHGQEAGDRLLDGMGRALRSSLRAVDASARLAGDEFAVLLPDSDPLSIESVLDRLRLVLVQAAAEKGSAVTVSLGAASFPRPPSSLDEMLRAAGRMLGEVKANGRDGVRHQRLLG